MKKDVTEVQIETLRQELQRIDGINTIEYVSKEDALNQMKEKFGEKSYLLDVYNEANVFPASYVVTLTDLNLTSNVQEKIKSLDNIKNVTSSDETIATLIKIARGIKIGSYIIIIVLTIVSIFIISNTIKLTVYARRKEISIMKYVGATNGFIRGPFIIEGIIIGVISAFITLGIVDIVYSATMSNILSSSVMKAITISLYSFNQLFAEILLIYLLLGTSIGIIGSSISMRKYLKV